MGWEGVGFGDVYNFGGALLHLGHVCLPVLHPCSTLLSLLNLGGFHPMVRLLAYLMNVFWRVRIVTANHLRCALHRVCAAGREQAHVNFAVGVHIFGLLVKVNCITTLLLEDTAILMGFR